MAEIKLNMEIMSRIFCFINGRHVQHLEALVAGIVEGEAGLTMAEFYGLSPLSSSGGSTKYHV